MKSILEPQSRDIIFCVHINGIQHLCDGLIPFAGLAGSILVGYFFWPQFWCSSSDCFLVFSFSHRIMTHDEIAFESIWFAVSHHLKCLSKKETVAPAQSICIPVFVQSVFDQIKIARSKRFLFDIKIWFVASSIILDCRFIFIRGQRALRQKKSSGTMFLGNLPRRLKCSDLAWYLKGS